MSPTMETLTLEIFGYTPMGRFGRVYLPQVFGGGWFYTIEDQWRDNEPFKSCIPENEYICRKGTYPKHGVAFEVLNVPNRTAVLFGHVANNEDDIEGCVGLGLGLGWVQSKRGTVPKWSVTGSTLACERFMTKMKDVAWFKLKIAQYKP